MKIRTRISWGCEQDFIVLYLIDPRDRGYAEQNRAKSETCSFAQETLNSVPGEEGAELLLNFVIG